MDALRKENEAIRRLPRPEQDRIWADMEAEERQARQLAAGVARRNVEPTIAGLERRHRAYVAARRRDVNLSLPDALAGVDANGMIMLHLLAEALRPVIEQASAHELLDAYQRALERNDARSVIEAELIEQRLARGGVAATDDDLPVVRQLADYIDGVQDLRIEPAAQLREIEETIQHARKAISRADVAQVLPLDAERHPAAKAAFENEQQEYAEALAAEAGQ